MTFEVLMAANILNMTVSLDATLATLSGTQGVTFHRNLLPPSLGYLYPEDGGSRFLCNTAMYLPDYEVSHPRRS
jgi:hypothetical protein